MNSIQIKASDVKVGDKIELDCGYGPHEFMKFCLVIHAPYVASQLFPDEKTKDYLSFPVDDGGERFTTIPFSPDHLFNVIQKKKK